VLLMPNLNHLTHGISNLVSLITKTKLGLSEDTYIRLRPLKLLFPALYNNVRRKSASISSVFYDTVECNLQEISDGC
jgi:hypothetical protein